jgi:hypothetical protein
MQKPTGERGSTRIPPVSWKGNGTPAWFLEDFRKFPPEMKGRDAFTFLDDLCGAIAKERSSKQVNMTKTECKGSSW